MVLGIILILTLFALVLGGAVDMRAGLVSALIFATWACWHWRHVLLTH